MTTWPWRSLGALGSPREVWGRGRRKQVEGVGQRLRTQGCRAGGPRILPKASSSGPAPDTPPSSIPPAPAPQRTTFSPRSWEQASSGPPVPASPSSSTFVDESNYTHQKYKSDHRSLCNSLKWKGQTPCPDSRESHLAPRVSLVLIVQLHLHGHSQLHLTVSHCQARAQPVLMGLGGCVCTSVCQSLRPIGDLQSAPTCLHGHPQSLQSGETHAPPDTLPRLHWVRATRDLPHQLTGEQASFSWSMRLHVLHICVTPWTVAS